MDSWKRWLGAPAAVLGVVLIAACGSSSSSSTSTSTGTSTSSTTSSASTAVAKLVPASVKSKGTLTVAADASYAPNEFIGSDGHTVVGMDADLSNAIAAQMGLKANIVNATFDTIIPGLAAGKYDMGASSFTDTKERQKTVNFVDYFVAGTSFFTKASGGTAVIRARRPVRQDGLGRERNNRGDRREGAELEVQVRRQGGRDRARVPDADRGQPGAVERPRAGVDGRLAGRRHTRSSSRTGPSRSPARPTAARRTGSRCRRRRV